MVGYPVVVNYHQQGASYASRVADAWGITIPENDPMIPTSPHR